MQTPNKHKRRHGDREMHDTQELTSRTKVSQVEEDLRWELHGNVYTEQKGFLEGLFKGVDPELVDAIFSGVQTGSDPLYANGRWSKFPQPPAAEREFYAPFVEIGNRIVKACSSDDRNLRWLSDPDRPPSTDDDKAALMKPDIVGALNFPAGHDASTKAGPAAPWNRILVPIEVKKKKEEAAGPAASQLFKYQRQIFRLAPDRRFVFGMTLVDDLLCVYLADRSGILGAPPFNIHEHPTKLIRVLAGFSVLKISSLGWDTTMRAMPRDPIPNQEPLLSYQIPFKDMSKWKDHYWRVELESAPRPFDPADKEGENGGDNMTSDTAGTKQPREFAFVLFEFLSLRRGESITGRATRIWKAWDEDQMERRQEDREVYILKDTWRDYRRKPEGELYAQIASEADMPVDGVAEMFCYGVVRVDKSDDSTAQIRGNIAPTTGPVQIDKQQLRKPVGPPSLHSPKGDTAVITLYVGEPDYLPPIEDLQSKRPLIRIHSRLVIKTYGWSIKYASSLSELVGAMRGAIIGHRNSYEKHVLHRDISLGNILITDKLQGSGHRGVLIDYDNAVKIPHKQHVTDDPLSGTLPFMSAEILVRAKYFRREGDGGPEPSFQHDLEAFFWVLVYLCLSRGAPALRRTELLKAMPENPMATLFQGQFFSLFEAADNAMGYNKYEIMTEPDDLRRVVRNISGWCRPLVPLVEAFHKALVDTYKSREMDGLYDAVISAFDEALKLDALQDESEHSKMYLVNLQQEMERRKKDFPGDWDKVNSPSAKGLNPASRQGSAGRSSLAQAPPSPSPVPGRKRAKVIKAKQTTEEVKYVE